MNRYPPFVKLVAIAMVLVVAADNVHAADIQPAINEFNALHHAKAKPMFQALAGDKQHKNMANYYLGRIALGSGDYSKAREYLEAGIEVEPNTADEHYWLALACYSPMQGASQATSMDLFFCYLQNLDAAHNVDPKHLLTLLAMYQFHAVGPVAAGASRETAEQLLTQIDSISKADAAMARLVVLNRNNEPNKAIALAQSVVATYPMSERALLEAGRALSNNQRYAEALVAFEKVTARAINMDNRNSIQYAYYEIGQLSWRTKADIDRGIAALLKSVDASTFPTNGNTNWAYWRLAQLHKLKGDAAQQKKYLALLQATGIEKAAALMKEME